jgi:hypothetical protein
MEINSLTSQIKPGTSPKNYLPEHPIPWKIMQFREVLCAVHPELGCFVYHEEQWKQCMPQSTNPLVYSSSWYFFA